MDEAIGKAVCLAREKGGRRILFFCENAADPFGQLAFPIFRQALAKNGLSQGPDLAFFGTGPKGMVFPHFSRSLAGKAPWFDAVFCLDYRVGMEIENALTAILGFERASRILLITTRNAYYAPGILPHAFITVDYQAIAAVGAKLLFEIMDSPHVIPVRRILLPAAVEYWPGTADRKARA
jgi:DNA-binding LacI/PurR family transcriptional regulator